MDPKEKYVTTLLRTLVEEGLIIFGSSVAGAILIGPYGYVLGPAVAFAFDYFFRTTEEELNAEWTKLTKLEIIKIAIGVAVKLAIRRIPDIIKIAMDIISLLKRLFNVGKESAENAGMLLHYVPSS